MSSRSLSPLIRRRRSPSSSRSRAILRSILLGISYIKSLIVFVLSFIIGEAKRRKTSFAIGLTTIVLSMFFITVLNNTVSKSGFVFMRLAENNVGEGDLLIQPMFAQFSSGGDELDSGAGGGDSPQRNADTKNQSILQKFRGQGVPFLNESLIREKLRLYNSKLYGGSAPRWILPLSVTLPKSKYFDSGKVVPAILLGADMEQEKLIDLGRLWKNRPTLKGDECLISSSIWQSLSKRTDFGEFPRSIIIRFSLSDILARFGTSKKTLFEMAFNNSIPDIFQDQIESVVESFFNTSLDAVDFELKVVDLADSPEGKWPSALGSTVFMDMIAFSRKVKEFVLQKAESFRSKVLNDTDTLGDQIIDLLVLSASFGESMSLLNPNNPDIPDTTIPGTNFTLKNIIGFLPNLTDAVTDPNFASKLKNSSLWKQFSADQKDSFVNRTIDMLEQVVLRFNISHYSMTIYVQASEHIQIYARKISEMSNEIARFSDEVVSALGINFQAKFSVPLAAAIQKSEVLQSLLDAILWSILSISIVLSSILIYSLLVWEADAQTFEIGMLRSLGMKKNFVKLLLTFKSLAFSFFGIPVALLISYLVFIPIANYISNYAAIDVSEVGNLTSTVILTSCVIGVLVPLIATVGSVSNALSSTLRDSLDLYRDVMSGFKIRVVKLTEKGLDLLQVCLGLLLVTFGIATFVVIPSAFVMMDFGVVLDVLDAVLMLMILGLVVLSSLFQKKIELLILRILTADVFGRKGPHLAIRDIVQKNLSGHKIRNSKTSIMFTIGNAFVLFAAIVASLQSSSIVDGIKSSFGSDICGILLGKITSQSIDEAGLRSYLASEKQKGTVIDYTFVSDVLRTIDPIQHVWLSNLASFPKMYPRVTAIEDNYLSATFHEYTVVTENLTNTKNSKSPPKISVLSGRSVEPDYMYTTTSPQEDWQTVFGTQSIVDESWINSMESYKENCSVLVSENYRDYVNVDTQSFVAIHVRYYSDDKELTMKTFLCSVQLMTSKFPGFFVSSHQATVMVSSVMIPMSTLQNILESITGNPVNQTSIPKRRLMVRLSDGLSSLERRDIVDTIRIFYRSQNNFILDTQDLVNSAESSLSMLSLIFIVIGGFAMFLCFFILILSVAANLKATSWELGVFRSLGLNSNQIFQVFLYETICVVGAAMLLGTLIGFAIGTSLDAQFSTFMEFPFKFIFPFKVFFAMFGMTILTCFFGTYLPMHAIRRKTVASTLKKN